MGFLERLGEAARTVAEGVYAPLGFVVDIASAPWNGEEEFNGFLNTFRSRGATRLGQFGRGLDTLLGPTDEAFGAGVGWTLDRAEDVYREGISEPLSTLALMARDSTITAQQGGGGFVGRTMSSWEEFLDPERWAQAHEQAQTTSIGQAFTLWLGAQDAQDFHDAQITDLEGRPTLGDPRFLDDPESLFDPKTGNFRDTRYNLASGAIDAAARWYLDPLVLGGKGAAAVRNAAVVRPITPRTNIDTLVRSRPTNRFLGELERRGSVGERMDWLMRNKVIRDAKNGTAVAHLLAEAPDTAMRRDILRIATRRDPEAFQRLERQRQDIAFQMAHLSDVQVPALAEALKVNVSPSYRQWGRQTLDDMHTELAALDKDDALLDLMQRSEAALATAPRVALGQRVEQKVKWSVYQPNRYNVPLRVIKSATTMRPGVLDLNRPDSGLALQRMLDRAGLSPNVKGDLLNRYAAAWGKEADQMQVVQEAELAAMGAALKKAGLPDSPAMVDAVTKTAWQRRDEVLAVVRDRAYSGARKPDGHYIDFVDIDGVPTRRPLDVPQLANTVPLLDVDAVTRMAQRYKSIIAADMPGFINAIRGVRGSQGSMLLATAAEEVASTFNMIWKPAQLLRLGWPLRVITDEQLRIISKVGIMSHLPLVAESAGRSLRRARAPMLGRTSRRLEGVEARLRAEVANPDSLPGVVEGLVKTRDRLARKLARQEERIVPTPFGQGDIVINSYRVGDAYGPATAEAPSIYRGLAGSRPAWQRLAEDSGRWVDHARAGTWVNLTVKDKGYYDAWERAVNSQIGSSPVARQILQGRTDDEVVAWLRSTPEGLSVTSRMGYRGRNVRQWVEQMRVHVDHYLPTDELQSLALSRRASRRDLQRAIPEETLRPEVHGAGLDDSLGAGAMRIWRGFVDRAYTALGSAPTDTLSRHPYFIGVYRQRLAKHLDDYDPGQTGKLSQQVVDRLAKRSREEALGEVRKLLYDLSEESNLAHTLRFLSPFYAAWQEGLTRWLSIAVDKPYVLARGVQFWNAPNKAGVVVDRDGNVVAPGAGISVDQYILAPMPEWARKHIPGAEMIGGEGGVAIPKQGLNLLLQGEPWWLPGFGPMVQVPVASLVRGKPDVADSVSYFLPYGPGQDALDLVLPAYGRRARAAAEGEDNRTYANAVIRRTQELYTDRALGKNDLTDEQLYAKAERDVAAFWRLRTVANATLPFSPWFRSPYQFWIDKAREYRLAAKPGDDWEARYLQDFGEEYFAFTESFSKTNTGVAPTVEGYRSSKKYEDLIVKNPELGGLIVGEEDEGEFASAVYDYQFGERIGPGRQERQRETKDSREAIASIQRRQGWQEWRQMMTLLDATLFERGLTSFQQRGAEDLAAIKAALRDDLSARYPEWRVDFDQFDRGKASRNIAAIQSFVDDKRFEGRAGWGTLKSYLDLRDMLVQVLQERDSLGGSADLTANSNVDLATLWDSEVGIMRERDLAFADIWYRHLQSDNLQTGE